MKVFFRSTIIAILTGLIVIVIFFVYSSLLKTEKPGFVAACVCSLLMVTAITYRHPETKWYLAAFIYLPLLLLLVVIYKGALIKFYLDSIFICIVITYFGTFLGAWLYSRKIIGLSKQLILLVSIVSVSCIIFLAIYSIERNARLNKPLIAVLDTIFQNDQKIIQQARGMDLNSLEWKTWNENMNKTVSANIIKVTDIINKYGWLGEDVIGWQGNSTLWVVIQHSPMENQEKYLPLLREAVRNGKARADQLALLEDRILINKGKEQIYGSQVRTDSLGKNKFWPILDERNVNKRRLSVGLGPLQWYAKQFGIKYKIPKKVKLEH